MLTDDSWPVLTFGSVPYYIIKSDGNCLGVIIVDSGHAHGSLVGETAKLPLNCLLAPTSMEYADDLELMSLSAVFLPH